MELKNDWIDIEEFIPARDTFVVKALPAETDKKTETGLILATNDSVVHDRPNAGIIVLVGPDADRKVGEFVYFQKTSGYDLNIFWKQIIEELHNLLINLTLGRDNKYFTNEDIKELIYIQTVFNKALIEAKNFPNPKHIYQLAVLKLNYLHNIVSIKELLEKGINITTGSQEKELKEIKSNEEVKKKSLDYILKEVKAKLGGVVHSILKGAKIEDREDSFIIFINKSLVKTIDSKDIKELSNIFGKPVKLEPLEEKVEKKEDKKEESVEKVLELFKGKIISYKKKNS